MFELLNKVKVGKKWLWSLSLFLLSWLFEVHRKPLIRSLVNAQPLQEEWLQVGTREALESRQRLTYLHPPLSLRERSRTDRRRWARKLKHPRPPRRRPSTQHKISIEGSVYILYISTFAKLLKTPSDICSHFPDVSEFLKHVWVRNALSFILKCTFDSQRLVWWRHRHTSDRALDNYE